MCLVREHHEEPF